MAFITRIVSYVFHFQHILITETYNFPVVPAMPMMVFLFTSVSVKFGGVWIVFILLCTSREVTKPSAGLHPLVS